MGTEPGNVATDAAAHKAKLDALVKDAEEAEEKAVAARRRARAAHALLEEEQEATALEKAAVAARQLVPGSSSSPNHTPPSSSSYEETVIAGLHLQSAVVLNVRSLVNIVLDSSSTTYASWRDLMMMVLERYTLDHVNSDVASSTDPVYLGHHLSIIRVALMSCVMLVCWVNTPGCLSPVPRIGRKNLLI
jgi:hypothetical protein